MAKRPDGRSDSWTLTTVPSAIASGLATLMTTVDCGRPCQKKEQSAAHPSLMRHCGNARHRRLRKVHLRWIPRNRHGTLRGDLDVGAAAVPVDV